MKMVRGGGAASKGTRHAAVQNMYALDDVAQV